MNTATDFSTPFDVAFDVVIVGTGAAGLYTALCLPEDWRVALITKDEISLSASDWAQGGIAAVTAPDDSTDLHIADTLVAGAGLCEPQAVEFLVNHAPHCVESLLRLGVAFDRKNSTLALTREAAHSRPRVLHAADTTGRAVVSTLTAQVLQRPNIQVIPQAFVLQLWLDAALGHCRGIQLAFQGRIQWVQARAVILATGGGGQVFAHTTNPTLSTGDGVAIAYRAGALLRDLEFFQFHPTALMKTGAPRFLISEAVRGEGAHVLDEKGDRFLFHYHPDGELAPRDVVSRAIFLHLQAHKQAQPLVWLDLRPIDPAQIRHRFPNIIQVCQYWGIDLFQEPIPVSPAAHYWMGGVATDLIGQTSIPGLYAVGETASTGVHGANRLASNSLLECLVFGHQLSQIQLPQIQLPTLGTLNFSPSADAKVLDLGSWPEQRAWIDETRSRLAHVVWDSAGICREEPSMVEAIGQIEQWQAQFTDLPLTQALLHLKQGERAIVNVPEANVQIRAWGELGNLLDVAMLILKSGLFREESRGGHYRLDYPETLEAWQLHTLVQGTCWSKSPHLESVTHSTL